jgi:hypothetical protein
MLVGQQRGHVTVARLVQPGKELALLEIEMAADVLRDLMVEALQQRRQVGVAAAAVARHSRQALLQLAEQLQVRAMLVVEQAADLALKRHAAPNIGIQIPEYGPRDRPSLMQITFSRPNRRPRGRATNGAAPTASRR